jgi:hypothetical protein
MGGPADGKEDKHRANHRITGRPSGGVTLGLMISTGVGYKEDLNVHGLMWHLPEAELNKLKSGQSSFDDPSVPHPLLLLPSCPIIAPSPPWKH